MALDGLAKRLGLNLPAPRGAANDNNPELAHDAGAAKGPFWALFESVYVGRSVRHADGRRGLVAFGPYQDPSRSFEPVCSLRLEGQKNLVDVTVKELEQSWLQPSFVQDPQLVPEKVLELQRNNWGHLGFIQSLTRASSAAIAAARGTTTQEQQQQQPEGSKGAGAGPSAGGKGSGVAPAPTPTKVTTTTTTAGTASEDKGAAGANANGSARQPKGRATRGASDAAVVTAAQTLLAAANDKAAPAGGRKRGRPPKDDGDKGGAAAKRRALPKRASTARKSSAPVKSEEEEEEEDESEEEEEMVTPAEEGEEDEGSEEEGDEEEEEEESEDVEAVTPRGKGGQQFGAQGWVKGWTGFKYPKEVVCKPGDVRVSDLADDELEGEYEVETIVDEYTVGKKKWFLIKWKGYQLRPGTGIEGLQPGADPDSKGDWEPAKNINGTLLNHWRDKRPEWYTSQMKGSKRGKQ